jgi:hypothetical protein
MSTNNCQIEFITTIDRSVALSKTNFKVSCQACECSRAYHANKHNTAWFGTQEAHDMLAGLKDALACQEE